MTNTQTPFIVDSSRYTGVSGIRDYEVLGKLGEGTFGEVHKAQSKKTRAIVALKKILMHNEKDGFPITALREIKIMKLLSHPNVLRLEDMAIERPQSKGKEKPKAIIYMVTPYMDHDLSGMLENPRVEFKEPQIKCYLQQLLEGVRFLHNSHILHRDMKAANLLINNKGLLQIADFGLARHYDEPVPREGCGCGEARRDYTSLVVTRWYRPPELLLQLRRYTPAVDMWGVGCVFGEMFKRSPILMGKSDINQASIIFDLMGSPNDDNMPGWDKLPGVDPPNKSNWPARPGKLRSEFAMMGEQGLDLMSRLMRLDWRRRINAIDALKHPYFKTAPLPARREDLPTYEDSHELDRRRFKDQRAAAGALPPAPAGGTVGGGPNGDFMDGPPPYQSRPDSRDPRGPGINDRLPARDAYRQGPGGGPGLGPRDGGRVPSGRMPQAIDDRQPRRGWERHPNAPRLRPGEPISNGVVPRRANVDTYIPEYRKDDPGPVRRDDVPVPRRDEVPPRRDNASLAGDSYVPPSRGDRSWNERDRGASRDDRAAPPPYRDDRRDERRDDRRDDRRDARDRDYRDYRDRDDGGYSRNRERDYLDRDRRPRDRDDARDMSRDRRGPSDRPGAGSAQRRTRSRSPGRGAGQDLSYRR